MIGYHVFMKLNEPKPLTKGAKSDGISVSREKCNRATLAMISQVGARFLRHHRGFGRWPIEIVELLFRRGSRALRSRRRDVCQPSIGRNTEPE